MNGYERFLKRRPFCLVAGILLNLLGGIGYAWSVLVFPLQDKFGWPLALLALSYTINSVTMLLANALIVSPIKKRLGIRKTVLAGGLLYGVGIMVCGYVNHLVLFWLFYSVLSGLGNSLIYPVLISYSQDLYPERSGMASGLMTAGLGLGSVIWASVANHLILMFQNVSAALLVLGAFFLVCIELCALVLQEIPEGFVQSFAQTSAEHQLIAEENKTRKEMLRDKRFPVAYLGMLCGCICGTMIITQGSPVMQTLFGYDATAAAAAVSIFSACNTAGRPLWGYAADRLGKLRTMCVIYAIMVFSMTALSLLKDPLLFTAAMAACLFCFGGVAALVAPVTTELWGRKHIAENYGITFSVFGLSSIVGSPVAAAIFERNGSYRPALILGLAVSALGLCLFIALLIKRIDLKKRIKAV